MNRAIVCAYLFACLSLPMTARAETAKLTIVQVSDLYQLSEENGAGGVARLAAVVKAERAAGKHVIFVHAGDAFSPSLMSGIDHGESMVDMLNGLHPDIFVPGNHEFDFGKDTYLTRVAQAQFPFLAANLRDAAGQRLPKHMDHMILDIDGVKVGIAGAVLEETKTTSTPGDLTFSPVVETIASEAKAMKQDGADVTIAIVHANLGTVWKLYGGRIVDVILSGHNHDLRIAYDGRTAMAESGRDAQFVTVTDLKIEKSVKDGKVKIVWKPNFRIIDTADVTPDPETLVKVKSYEDQFGKEFDVPIATLDQPLDSRTETVRGGECAIGNLIADAMRAATGADLAITNGGGIRGNKLYLASKQITRRDILTELPFGNKTVLVKIKGADLLASLENGFGKLPEVSGGFPQVAGMHISVAAGRPMGNRVVKVMVGEKPLDPSSDYTLATNDYMLAGGDGYTNLSKAQVLRPAESATLIANDVMVQAKKLDHLTLAVEGRIAITN